MRLFLRRILRYSVALAALVVLSFLALVRRRESRRRARAGVKPRLVYGRTAIISIKYMSAAMRKRGYETTTVVARPASINERADFDLTLDDLVRGPRSGIIGAFRQQILPYAAFGRLLGRGDVFHFFFDGGFLCFTPLRFLELQLLHLAGKKVVAMPYGGDAAAVSRMHSREWRSAYMRDYPEIASREAGIVRWLDYFSRRADFIVACLVHAETLPRYDLLTTHYYPIDLEAWNANGHEDDAADAEVLVFHSPNHRALKGTEFLVRACRELREEGLPVRLVLAEGIPNREVKRLLRSCDILAEQFILGYALSAMEGMALRKPVLSNLSDPEYYDVFRASTGLDECPIVSTTPAGLKETLRSLVLDPGRRARLGEEGRRYVEKYHSLEAVGRMWELVYDHVWAGRPLPVQAWHPERIPPEAESPPSAGRLDPEVAR